MSDYARQNDFSVKDGLTTGDPAKLIKGSEVDAEFDAIVPAVASKIDEPAAPVAKDVLQWSGTAWAAVANIPVPPGVVVPYAGSSAPGGWLLCNGAEVSRTTYAVLFAIVGTTYGIGDGSTTFDLPDMQGRVPAGKEASATLLTSAGGGVDGATLGDTGGTETHTLTIAEMPAHTHTNRGTITTGAATAGGAIGDLEIEPTGSTGGDGPHPNVQPTIILNYLIKT